MVPPRKGLYKKLALKNIQTLFLMHARFLSGDWGLGLFLTMCHAMQNKLQRIQYITQNPTCFETPCMPRSWIKTKEQLSAKYVDRSVGLGATPLIFILQHTQTIKAHKVWFPALCHVLLTTTISAKILGNMNYFSVVS